MLDKFVKEFAPGTSIENRTKVDDPLEYLIAAVRENFDTEFKFIKQLFFLVNAVKSVIHLVLFWCFFRLLIPPSEICLFGWLLVVWVLASWMIEFDTSTIVRKISRCARLVAVSNMIMFCEEDC